jgi:hypothetical protein
LEPKNEQPLVSGPTAQGHLFETGPGDKPTDSSLGRELRDWREVQLAVQEIVAEFRKVVAPLRAIAELKPRQPDILDKLDQALARLASGESVGKTVEALRAKGREVIARGRRQRVEEFKRIEAEFIRRSRDENHVVRESAEGWRLGPLELQVRREQAQCRTLYNREVLLDWSRVATLDDIQQISAKSLELLKKWLLPESTLADSFWEAYEECRARRRAAEKGNPDVVPLLDFYRELRLALARHDLAQRPDKKFSYPEFPKWAFLHNLDVYMSRSSSLPADRRLTLQTGSQQETRRIGMVVNGLDARQEYKAVCFIRQG